MFSITCKGAHSIYGHFVGRAMTIPDVKYKTDVTVPRELTQSSRLVNMEF